MKNILFIYFLVLSIGLFSQSIPNGGFESWNSIPYQNPNHFIYTSNFEKDFQPGYPNAIRVTDSYAGNWALKLSTVGSGTNLAFSYVANGTPLGNFSGGVPCTQKPNGLRFYYKSNIVLGDTALVALAFKKSGIPIGQYIYKISSSSSNYSLFNTNFSPVLQQIPDTVILAIVSSNALGTSVLSGNMFQIDSLSLKGITQPPLLNGNFEQWQNQIFYNPTGWKNSFGTTKTTDLYTGTAAIELQTTPAGGFSGNARPSRATTGLNFNTSKMGYPYSNMIDTLIFFYKYIPAHPSDTAIVQTTIKKNNSVIGGPVLKLPFNASYTQVKLPLNVGTAPDSLIVNFNSSKIPTPLIFGGSDLKIDNLYLKSQMIPQSSFSTSATACVGIPIQLTDLSFNMPNSWAWITPGGTTGSSTLQNPTVTYNTPGTKTITMVSSNQFGSGATVSQSITVFPNPNVTVTSTTTPCGGSSVNLTATGAISYSWNTGQTTSVIITNVTSYTTYTVTGYNNGCSAIATATIFVPSPATPQICMVTTDSLGINNQILWDKTQYNKVDSFIVYRETPTVTNTLTGAYSRIGAVSFSALSLFTDTARSIGGFVNGDPRFTSYKYKLQIRDSCGTYGFLSPYHQTIFVQDQQNGNFNWNPYTVEGNASPVNSYMLYRRNITTGATTTVAATSSFLLSDPYYTVFFPTNIKWFVDAEGFSCNPALKINSTMVLKSRTKSNQTNERQFPQSINDKPSLKQPIEVYPNPTKNLITINTLSIKNTNCIFKLVNPIGRILFEKSLKIIDDEERIDLSSYNSGIYFLIVSAEGKNLSVNKVIKE